MKACNISSELQPLSMVTAFVKAPHATLAVLRKCGHLSVLGAIVPASKSAGKPIGKVIFDGGFFAPFFTTVFLITGRNSLLSPGVAGSTTEG